MIKNEHTLPMGWSLVPIEELFGTLEDGRTLHQGWSPKCESQPSDTEADWGVLRTTAIQPGHFRPEHNKRLPSTLIARPQIEVHAGDILITCAGPRSRCGIAALVRDTRKKLMMSGKMYRFRVPPEHLDASYIEAFLQTPNAQSAIDQMKTGGSDSGLNLTHDRFRRLKVPVAPLNEQRRIAELYEELSSDLEAAATLLEQVKARLITYRASVLKAAVDGSLTAEWRNQHSNVEPASELLKRILAERRRRWAEEQLRRFKEKDQEPPKNWKLKYHEPLPPDIAGVGELPTTWCWASLDQLSEIAGGVTKGQKFLPSQPTRMVSYLRVANVQRGYLDLGEIKQIRALTSDITALRLQRGDVLFNEGGDRDKLGRGWIWEDAVDECIHQNHVFRARLLMRTMNPKLVSWCGNSYGQRWFMRTGKQSVNLASINMTVLRSFPVALVSPTEEEAVVEAVEDHLSVIDHLEADIDAKLISAKALRQSILCHAFTGQLVTQDPNDEPASELLNRIATEREQRAREAAAAKQAKTPTKKVRTRPTGRATTKAAARA